MIYSKNLIKTIYLKMVTNRFFAYPIIRDPLSI